MFVKIKINLPNFGGKFVVDLVHDYHLTVLDFIERAMDLCSIQGYAPQQLELIDAGYVLPHRLPSKALNISTVYTLRLSTLGKKERKKTIVIEKQKSPSISVESVKSSSEQSQSIQSQKAPTKMKSFPAKQLESRRNNKKYSSSSGSPLPTLNKKRIKSSSQHQQKVATKKVDVLHRKKAGKSSSSSSPMQEIVEKKKPQRKKMEPKSSSSESQKIVTCSAKKHEVKATEQKEAEVKKAVLNIKPVARKVVSDSESSLSEVQQGEKKMIQKQAPKAKMAPRIVPISVRNKAKAENQPSGTVKSFQQHQELQWITITKALFDKWKAENQTKPILMINNEIRFKIMELDEEKFVPVLSGWICGTVQQINSADGKTQIVLRNATLNNRSGEGSQFQKEYPVSMMNMQELQIKRTTVISEEQKLLVSQAQAEVQKQENCKPLLQQASKEETAQNAQSVEDFICGQTHYYFGEKNYPTDLFMQMHANKDPDRYIPIGLLLNFPKIKKILRDESKLWQYLTEDEKIGSRSYQLDYGRRMIRKKLPKGTVTSEPQRQE